MLDWLNWTFNRSSKSQRSQLLTLSLALRLLDSRHQSLRERNSEDRISTLFRKSCLRKNSASNARSQNIEHMTVLRWLKCMRSLRIQKTICFRQSSDWEQYTYILFHQHVWWFIYFKSFTVDVILSSLEKIFRSLALINTEVTDMTFIDESLMSELCECFDIQSISLSKSKSIQSYDEISDQKSITHALYTLIMIQEHKNEMMFLLITRLDQHKIIIENLWLKRNQMLIDSANNRLISSLKIQTSKSVVSKASSQSAFHRSESNKICEMKRKNLNLIVTSMIILKRLMNQKSVNRFIELTWFIESALIAKQST